MVLLLMLVLSVSVMSAALQETVSSMNIQLLAL